MANMPKDDGGVASKLSGAKKALNDAHTFSSSFKSGDAGGKDAATPMNSASSMATAATGIANKVKAGYNAAKTGASNVGKTMDGGADAAQGLKDVGTQIAGSFKKGGKVKKTGIYQLHEGETVVPVAKKLGGDSKKKSAKTKEMTVRKVNGGYHVKHQPAPGAEKTASPSDPSDNEHMVPNMEALKAHLEQHMESDGDSDDAGQSGADQQQSAPAPQPNAGNAASA